jgi:hypothetical protein
MPEGVIYNIQQVPPITIAIRDLQQIISRRISAFVNKETLNLDAWLDETFGNNLVKADIASLLPKTPTNDEWIVLMLALAPHLLPNVFESVIAEYFPNGGEFPEFGGAKSGNHRSMLPTGETALFLLAGTDVEQRVNVQQLFAENHFFNKAGILWLEEVKEGEPKMSGRIILSADWLSMYLTGEAPKPKFGVDFPAKWISTRMTWDDLILHPQTRRQIDTIATWLAHKDELMQDSNLSPKLKPGYKVLFYGPSGTGKTLTATLIGKQFKKDVYRIDLSQVVSKYIGETEKNLEKVFLKAEHQDCVLFFDEADALFGKRTIVQSSHDKHGNQEVSYLLQRMEDFSGLLVLASNFKGNIDAAFLRRFQQMIHFPAPDAEERFQLWQKALPARMLLHPDTDLRQIAQKYEITGAAVINVMQYVCLQSLMRGDNLLHPADFLEGMRREFQKEEKYI